MCFQYQCCQSTTDYGYCRLHYWRLNVRTKVATTPHSMRNGSQVLRKAAQLKDRRWRRSVRIIFNTYMFHAVRVKHLRLYI